MNRNSKINTTGSIEMEHNKVIRISMSTSWPKPIQFIVRIRRKIWNWSVRMFRITCKVNSAWDARCCQVCPTFYHDWSYVIRVEWMMFRAGATGGIGGRTCNRRKKEERNDELTKTYMRLSGKRSYHFSFFRFSCFHTLWFLFFVNHLFRSSSDNWGCKERQ